MNVTADNVYTESDTLSSTKIEQESSDDDDDESQKSQSCQIEYKKINNINLFYKKKTYTYIWDADQFLSHGLLIT